MSALYVYARGTRSVAKAKKARAYMYSADLCAFKKQHMARLSNTQRGIAVGLIQAGVAGRKVCALFWYFLVNCKRLLPYFKTIILFNI